MNKIIRKTLLYRSGVEYADYCINHVEGCAHGCRFPCYAMLLKKRTGAIHTYQEWLEPKIVANALNLLDKEIPKNKGKINYVHLCFSTDPFMYKYPEVGDLTLQILEKLNLNGIRTVVLTKGIYPEILTDVHRYGSNNEYGVTLVSLDHAFKEAYEPFSAPYQDRIRSLRLLHDGGIKTWVSMEPYPTPNMVKQPLADILNEVAFVDKIVFGKLNYNQDVHKYPQNKDFYDNCAQQVIEFCRNRNIECHIKYGTRRLNDTSTHDIFTREQSRLQNLQPCLTKVV